MTMHTMRRLVSVCSAAFVILISCGGTLERKAPNPAIVTAHSEGLVSRFSDVSVVLARSYDPSLLANAAPFTFSPPLAGSVSWSADGSRIDFRPETPLAAGKTYHVVFDFVALGEPQNGWFSFDIRAAEPSVTLETGTLYTAFDGSLSLDGVLVSDDIASSADVETIVKASVGGKKLAVSWSHEGSGLHRFTVKRIPRGAGNAELTLAWDASRFGSKTAGKKNYSIPKEGSFEILSVSAPKEGGCITVSASEPFDKTQDFRGLIRTNAHGELRYEVEGGIVRVYSSLRWPERVDVRIEQGLKSRSGAVMAIPVSAAVDFNWEKPEVRFQKGGVIIPSTDGTKVVLETKNLARVTVEALRVYGDNMLQFMQVNELDGTRELKRVGDVVWRSEIDLGWSDANKNEWMTYGLDLTPLLAKHPDGLFQLRVAFGHSDTRYVSPRGSGNIGKWKFPPVVIADSGDDESSYWDGAEEWFDWDEYYKYRDDPSHPAFYITRYGRDRTARRNILVSDVALSAKKDIDDTWHVVASDIRSARPLQGATVKLYTYSLRLLASARADKNGLALFKLKAGDAKNAQPFFAVAEMAGAKTGRERGYLKLSAAQAISVSHFDVGGEKNDSGLKGCIYGERGVWRPGDDIHLSFILYDMLKTLPKDHPVQFELENPLGQIVRQQLLTKPVGNFYYIKTGTEQSAPTGSWTARVSVGAKTFTKKLKIETVMPNRMKLALDHGTRPYLSPDVSQMTLRAAWLHGAPAPGLSADVAMILSASDKAPGDYAGFSFLDPLRKAPERKQLLFEGRLDDKGSKQFTVDLDTADDAPGPLTAMVMTRVFERSGLFSSEFFSLPFHPYARYVGVKLPKGDEARGMLLTDKAHPVEIILVDRDGKIRGDAELTIEVYKLQWRWWWEKGSETLAEHAEDIYKQKIKRDIVRVKNGRAVWNLSIKYPDWGRYLIRVSDDDGHASGSVFYIDWPGWAGRGQGEGGGSAAMLSLSTDKPSYSVGETVRVSFPSNKAGRAYISLERAGRVFKEEWVEAKDGTTVYAFKADAAMAPNIYVHATFIQPHLQTKNDLPIRLYGVVPVSVENPDTRLNPVVTAPRQFEPMKKNIVTVFERRGLPMTYTLAVVDEGLLGITRYAAPNPWNEFYKKEASLLASYDMYNDVAGAYTGMLQTLLAIGGAEFGDAGGNRKVNRFPPVVRYFGPFTLGKGAKGAHELDLGPYVGAVRCMVVAGTEQGAFGVSELEVPVRSDLMVYAAAPRVLAPNETLTIPVTVFGFMGKNSDARVSISLEGDARIVGDSAKTVRFPEDGEQSLAFDIQVGKTNGALRLVFDARAQGNRVSRQTIDIPVRSPSVPVTSVASGLLKANDKTRIQASLPGVAGSNETWLELSLVPPIDLSARLAYLIGYPHGCAEQTVSKAFPQIFLNDVMALTPEQNEAARAHVAAAIDKMTGFQTTQGGFVFWPGAYEENDWLSNYVTHFLVAAAKRGFTVPAGMMNAALSRLRSQAESWDSQADHAKAEQAYRLYILALAAKPDIASMNRFANYAPYPASAVYQLGAAYALVGLKDKARSIFSDAPVDIKPHYGIETVYGSALREKAIVLDAFNAVGDTTRGLPIFKAIADDLSSGRMCSTQELSFALIAAMPYIQKLATGSASISYSYPGDKGSVTVSKAVSRIPIKALEGDVSVDIVNSSKSPVYARVVSTGMPEPGKEKTTMNGLGVTVQYYDSSEKLVDPASLPFGSDIIADISVRNTSGSKLNDIALTYRVASGWEISNMRLADDDEERDKVSYDYQDIRDDRVMTYFGLTRGASKTIRLYFNKTYEGSFFLPALTAEVMYQPEYFAVLSGRAIDKPAGASIRVPLQGGASGR